MIDFFISYAREDGDFARKFVDRLAELGWDIWIDEKNIPPSVPWMAEIQRAIDESMMVLALESESWLSSEACQIELGLAELARVPIARITPELHRLDELVALVLRRYRELPAARATALQAAASAAIWRTAGKKKAFLVRGRMLKVMRRALKGSPEHFSQSAKAFISASARAATQRWIVGLALTLVVPILVGGTWVSINVTEAVNAKVATSIADATEFADRKTYGDWNIYAGIERSLTEDADSFQQYHQLFSFLSVRTPWRWDAMPITQSGPTSADSPDGTRSATIDGAGIVIDAFLGGTTRLSASSAVTSLAWSPDSHWVAVSTADGAEVISVDNARSIELRGGVGETRVVRWEDTQNLAVGGSDGTGVWRVFDGRPLAELGGVRLGTKVDGFLYTIDWEGVVSRTDVESGASIVIAPGTKEGSTPTAMEATKNGLVIAFAAERPFLHVIDLGTTSTRNIPVPGCNPIEMSIAPNSLDAYLTCREPDVNETRVDLGSGAVVSQPAQQEQLAYGVRALNDTVLWGGSFGGVFRSDRDLTPRGMLTSGAGCGAPIRKFVGGSDGPMLFPIGDGTGSFGCGTRIDSSGATGVKRLIFDATDSYAVPHAATSSDGSLVAYGMSDGRVRVFSTTNLEPIYFAQVMPNQVRFVSFSSDKRSLLVAGIEGQVAIVPISPPTSATNVAALGAEAYVRLEQAVEWGIYASTMDPSEGGR
ncbi:TIR domain-containing protein [Rhodococcus sp. NPDC076796]|uniref:TIR domain-containing protein n=1 Tax=Rhodococcus sp. NPDC076796 TaxID=3154859 RepID=UPI002AD9F1D1|nr:TIR domain-containing protein [Rhodococcus sp. (in: high G+C Gram-positive bacteria)]